MWLFIPVDCIRCAAGIQIDKIKMILLDSKFYLVCCTLDVGKFANLRISNTNTDNVCLRNVFENINNRYTN